MMTLSTYDKRFFFRNNDQEILISGDKTVSLWDTNTGMQIYHHENYSPTVISNFLSESFIYTSNNGNIYVADQENGETLFSIADSVTKIGQATYNDQGSHIIATYQDGTTKVWRVNDGTVVHTFKGMLRNNVAVLNYNPDNSSLIYSSIPAFSDYAFYDMNAQTTIVDVSTKQSIHNFQSIGTPVLHSPNGKFIATYKDIPNKFDTITYVSIWETTTGEKLFELEHNPHTSSMVFNSTSTKIAIASEYEDTKVWDLDSGLAEISITGYANAVAFNQKGDLLAVAKGAETQRNLEIWDITTNELVHTINHTHDNIKSIFFTSQDKNLYSIIYGESQTLNTWQLRDGSLLKSIDLPTSNVTYSPDGSFLASTDNKDNGTVNLMRASDGEVLQKLEGHFDIDSIAFSSDGKSLAVGAGRIGEGNTITIYGTPLDAPVFIAHE